MPSQAEDLAYKKFAEDFGDAWAPKATRTVAALPSGGPDRSDVAAGEISGRRREKASRTRRGLADWSTTSI